MKVSSPVVVTTDNARSLLQDAGIAERVLSVELYKAGGNNRIFRVETTGKPYALKQYFKHEGDQRDRMGAEFKFLKYASKVTPRYVPIAYSQNVSNQLALYEFVHGKKITLSDNCQNDLNAATSFLRELNSELKLKFGADLPDASEACFSLLDHIAVVDYRITQLKVIQPSSGVDSEAIAFTKELEILWENLKDRIIRAAEVFGYTLNVPLTRGERCVSPSDFGFHNALRKESGEICFLDFEYAGWDDPAKTVGDFFSQLAVPIPSEYFARFVQDTMGMVECPSAFEFRANILRPLFQVKWCCIALNVFLPISLARRKFANPSLNEEIVKREQLVKGKNIFKNIIRRPYGLH